MYKYVKNLRLILLLIAFSLLSACSAAAPESAPRDSGGEGVLRQTVLSPFNDVLDVQESVYFAGLTNSPSKTVTKSRYSDFAINYDSSSLGFNSEPFCRIGGSYRVDVENINPNAENLNASTELYYCKTTEDLIKSIKIPSSWEGANLIFYCNDGSTINFANINFDFITSKVNTYKSCVLKNLDLEDKNTIMYGFEVGNKVVDSNPSLLFNKETSVSQITRDLSLKEVVNAEPKLANQSKEFWINFTETCTFKEKETLDSEFTGTSTCKEFTKTCSSIPPPGPGLSACGQELIDTTTASGVICSIPQTKRCDLVTPVVEAELAQFTNLRRVRNDDIIKQSLFEVDEIVGFNFTQFVFANDKSEEFFFEYDDHTTFYSLTNNNEELSIPITNVFLIPSDFQLSRVALFRSFSDGRKAIGLETPARLKIGAETTKPIYKISIQSRLGGIDSQTFDQNDCFENLASYDAKKRDSISIADTIICTSTNNIFLNSITLDQNFDKETAFNLFKNIILDLE